MHAKHAHDVKRWLTGAGSFAQGNLDKYSPLVTSCSGDYEKHKSPREGEVANGRFSDRCRIICKVVGKPRLGKRIICSVFYQHAPPGTNISNLSNVKSL